MRVLVKIVRIDASHLVELVGLIFVEFESLSVEYMFDGVALHFFIFLEAVQVFEGFHISSQVVIKFVSPPKLRHFLKSLQEWEVFSRIL